jgi:hypothetical protein
MTTKNDDKPRIGRPPLPGTWFRIHLYIEERTLQRLRDLGEGSQTEGLRVLFRRYDKLRARRARSKADGGTEARVEA